MVGSIGGTGSASSLVSPYLSGETKLARAPSSDKTSSGKPVTASDQELVSKLKTRDADVKAHEQAHRAAAGAYGGAPTYTYQKGPDGASYAIGGEVSIDTSPVPRDLNATIAKEEQVQRAALAPADPSGQDIKVAAAAAAAIGRALTDRARSGANGDASTPQGQTTAATAAQSGDGSPAQFARGLAAYAAATKAPRPTAGLSVHA